MNILTIGGSDPSSGAGIQSDIKTFSYYGVYGFTVITTVTSQNTKKVSYIEPVSIKSLKSQLESILSDFDIDAIKIGMVYNSDIIKVIHSEFNNNFVYYALNSKLVKNQIEARVVGTTQKTFSLQTYK